MATTSEMRAVTAAASQRYVVAVRGKVSGPTFTSLLAAKAHADKVGGEIRAL